MFMMKSFQIKMKCYICDEKRANFTFPKDKRLCFQWMSKLGLTEFPPSWASICCLHFSPCDLFYDAFRTALIRGAYPLVKVRQDILIEG